MGQGSLCFLKWVVSEDRVVSRVVSFGGVGEVWSFLCFLLGRVLLVFKGAWSGWG